MQTDTTPSTTSDPAYGMTVHLRGVSLTAARQRVADALATQGFGVLTEIDVAATLDKKLGVPFRPYLILGACNPRLAHRALGTDLGVGLLLPCNVCLWEEDGATVVSAVRPESMFEVVHNPALQPIVDEVSQRLRTALATLTA